MTKSKTSKSKGGKGSSNGRGSNSWKKNGPRKEFVKIEFTRHIPVLLQSVLEQLDLKKGQVFVDCNLGDGGHSEETAKTLDGDVTILGFDLDLDAIKRAGDNFEKAFKDLSKKPDVHFINDNFRNLTEALDKEGITKADAILYDLGLSSYELEESGRGFSFKKDEPLIMTFSNSKDADGTKVDTEFTAEDIINDWDEENIRTIIESYGEDKFAYKIAKGIIKAREGGRIKSTSQLAEIIKASVPSFARFGKTHPATKTLQALRIAINDELGALHETLPQAIERLKQGGRLVVISYHSLEDRIVKNSFKKFVEAGLGEILTKRPIVPTEEETDRNPRSRSAKMRVFQKN
ncbi:MAG: 16S rRNA (cytosine(1402)-N(4))-methyltransferase RsmH [bacterium]